MEEDGTERVRHRTEKEAVRRGEEWPIDGI